MPVRMRFAHAALAGLLAAGPVYAQHPTPAEQPAAAAREAACAPVAPLTAPAAHIRVISGLEPRKTLFGTGETVVVGAGAAHGLRTGDEYFVRRVVPDRFAQEVAGVAPISVHTAGILRVVEVRPEISTAVVAYGCDGVSEGDYLERFELPGPPEQGIAGTPDVGRPARVVLGAERRQTGAAGDFMILNRGSDDGVRPGQALTVFRTPVGLAGPVATVGRARVYSVLPKTSTIRIEHSVDAVYVGDMVAVDR